ncbi:hypothetical protein [Aquimarina sp. RZ0]|uniref:hypothetical protein n=1 Tax=Aquimarina sp. RZ0 TaxID=2607730 RepID=UPI0011F2682D|nr:hypothetical protein [Aquimarina sp. RZ0]KAA1245985.1 hypothetical protein F0000_09730 [Aquimarina sp. RZ0]
MKKTQLLLITSLFLSTLTSFAQVRIGGGVSIDINIDLPLPEVVVVSRRPEPVIRKPKPNRPIIHTCDHRCNHNDVYSFGEIQNQNGPQGRYVYQVTNAGLGGLNNGAESILYTLDTGETLELIIRTMNPDDYNYHYNNGYHNSSNNEIIAILLNGQEIAVKDGSLSLQPKHGRGFHSVLNIHAMYEGDFNGTVNF